jgi:RNase P subunit RPR2
MMKACPMVEVLRHGRAPNPVVDVTCRGCDALLRYRKSEGRHVPDSREGDAYVFTCPVCGHDNWVAADIVEGRRR